MLAHDLVHLVDQPGQSLSRFPGIDPDQILVQSPSFANRQPTSMAHRQEWCHHICQSNNRPDATGLSKAKLCGEGGLQSQQSSIHQV